MEKTIQLNILCEYQSDLFLPLLTTTAVAPRISLSFGANIDHTNILEGNDVYFECHIEANPEAYKVEWKKNVSYVVFKYFSLLFREEKNRCSLPSFSF